jgi:hypothetical protein
MISPCRIRQPRNRVDSLPLALLFAACLLAPVTEAMGQYAAGSSAGAGVSGGPSVPFGITAGVDMGYDDNVNIGGGGPSGEGALFTRENVVLSYDRSMESTQLNLMGVGRFDQFFGVSNTLQDDKDLNVTLSLVHNFSSRLSFRADVYGAYQTEPDFTSNVGPENVRAPHFATNDTFSVTYHWLPRFTAITSYTFQRIKYESSVQTSQDRMGNTLGEEFRFSLTRRTNLVAEYRFEIMDYDTAPRDSITHFALVGIDHRLTEHLIVNVLGGESFRSFKDDGDTIDPDIEGKLTYQSSNHSLSWTTSYRVEEPSETAASARTTIRTGLNLTYDLSSRVHSTTAVYYHHDENEGGSSGTSSVGSQDSLELSLGLRYTINKHFALHFDYKHTMQSSLESTPGYSRNRYFAGLTYTY